MSVKARVAFSWFFMLGYLVMTGVMFVTLPPLFTNWLTTWRGPPWNWICAWLLMIGVLLIFIVIFLVILIIGSRKGRGP